MLFGWWGEKLATNNPALLLLHGCVHHARHQGEWNARIHSLHFNSQIRARRDRGVEEQAYPTDGDIPHSCPKPLALREPRVDDLPVAEIANHGTTLDFHASVGKFFYGANRL